MPLHSDHPILHYNRWQFRPSDYGLKRDNHSIDDIFHAFLKYFKAKSRNILTILRQRYRLFKNRFIDYFFDAPHYDLKRNREVHLLYSDLI